MINEINRLKCLFRSTEEKERLRIKEERLKPPDVQDIDLLIKLYNDKHLDMNLIFPFSPVNESERSKTIIGNSNRPSSKLLVNIIIA